MSARPRKNFTTCFSRSCDFSHFYEEENKIGVVLKKKKKSYVPYTCSLSSIVDINIFPFPVTWRAKLESCIGSSTPILPQPNPNHVSGLLGLTLFFFVASRVRIGLTLNALGSGRFLRVWFRLFGSSSVLLGSRLSCSSWPVFSKKEEKKN